MKTYKNLIKYALSDECMDNALNKAKKNKGHRPDVQDVIANKEEIKQKIRDDVLNKKLKPLVHKAYKRLDGYRNKERLIIQPYFSRVRPEQWIQHITVEALKPVLTKGLYDFSCGSIPKRGVHFGKKYLAKYIEKNQKDVKYCLKIDVKHFYQSIDTDLLKYKFERIIKDEDMLYLIYWIIDNNIAILQDGSVISGGLTIGGFPSQWFANFFLQEFDHYLKEKLKVKFYIRYMDDIVVLGRNKRELHNVLNEIRSYFKGIHLDLKENYQVFKFHYVDKKGKASGRFIDFMGFKFYRNKTTIRKSIFLRACKTARRIKKTGKLTLKQSYKIVSYKGWFDDTNTFNAYKKHILQNVDINACRKLISVENKKRRKNEHNL